MVSAARPARLRGRGEERRLVGIRPRVRHRGLAGSKMLRNVLTRIVARRPPPRDVPAPGSRGVPLSRATSTRACSARSPASAAFPPCSTCSSRSTTPSSSTAGCAAQRSPVALGDACARRGGLLECALGRGRHARARRLLRALHAPGPVALRGALGRRRRGAVRPGRRSRRRRADPLVSHLHPAARLRDRRPRRRAARRRRRARSGWSATANNETAAEQLARELGLTNIEFVAPVPESELPGEIARASICLGVFGTSDKAARVVPEQGVPVRGVRAGRSSPQRPRRSSTRSATRW